jgi:ABC-type lipoprotein export system ATPase subunit
VPEVLVRARGLTKRFGSFTAVDGIDFDLFHGEAFGFLGPNGAGKSSTMRMLGCVSPPTLGELTILGGDPVRDGAAIRARLGVVPQEDTLDNELTVRENLLVYGRYFGLPRTLINERTDQLLDFVQLTERANDQVDPLSGGMKRRLTIARSRLGGHAEARHADELPDQVRRRAADAVLRHVLPGRPAPPWVRPVAYATPLWHGVALCRGLSLGDIDAGAVAIHAGYLAAMAAVGLAAGSRTYRRRLYV